MTIEIQPHALGFFAYVTDGARLVACGDPKLCPIEAVHGAAERAIRSLLRNKRAHYHLCVEGNTHGQAEKAAQQETV
jgi:hypothetical protein